MIVFAGRAAGQGFTVSTDHPDANYAVGETVNFLIQSNVSGPVNYTVTRGKYTPVLASGTVNLTAGNTTVVPVTSSGPENLHMEVTGGFGFGQATAMVGVDEMVPFASDAADFDAFWNGVKSQLAAVPMNPQVNFYSQTSYSKSYTVQLGNIEGRHVYGMLTVPNGAGPFPVLLKLPAYGSFPIPPTTEFAERANTITLSITIHNAPVTTTDPNAYQPDDPTDPNTNYYKQAVAAGVRALDYLTSRPDFNGTDVAVTGVSQGAGLAMLLAAIDDRVKLLLIGTPVFCSHHGELYDHPSGFPYYFHLPLQTGDQQAIDALNQAVKYYEAATAAKRFHGPVFLLTSYNDQVTVAETQFIASNFFDGPKVILHNLPGGHDNRPPEYLGGRSNYLRRYFPAANNPPFPWADDYIGYKADAGPDQNASAGVPISLTGTIEKETTTNPPSIPVTWRKVSGPGAVSFTNPNSHTTQATFSQSGTYVLEFRGKDTELLSSKGLFYTISDRVTITVSGGGSDPAPTVSLSTPSNTVTGPFVVTATFSEPVTGLTASDFIASNGSLSGFSGSGTTYSFTVTPVSAGTVTVQLPAGQAMDSAGQGNLASNTLIVTYSPATGGQDIDLSLDLTVNPASVDLYGTATFVLTMTNAGPATAHNVKVDFKLPQGFGLISSNPSAGVYNSWLGKWDLPQLAAGASETVTVIAGVNTSPPPPFYAQVTAADENDADSQPNNNPGPVPSEDDEAAVTVGINDPTPTSPAVTLATSSNSVTGPFVVTATFTQAVSGLTASDFVVTNGTASGLTGSGTFYQVTITPTTAGSVTVQLPAGVATDTQTGAGNTASNTLTVQYAPGGETGTYCEPIATPWHEWIARVQFGSIDNYSAKEMYGDFTDQTTDVAKGTSQQIRIRLGHGYWIYDEYYRVWIDFNQDNDFNDPGELVLDKFVAAIPNGQNPPDVVEMIQIPADALSGKTRMRVALHRDTAPMPCTAGGFGEFEDYSVNITDGGSPPPPPGTYCASASTPWHEWIAHVRVGTIDKYSQKEGYADFTNLSTDLPIGQMTPITIDLGHGYWIYDEYYRVWVDLNQDGDFADAGELVFSKYVPAVPNGTNPAPVIGQLNIPASALPGQTRMRVSLHRDSYGTPCDQQGFGEVEDYSVVLTDGQGGGGGGTYCEPYATPWHEWIARFRLADLDHASVKEGYGDFTNLPPAHVQQGANVSFTIDLGFGYWIYDERYKIWVDLNQDGDFADAGEELFSLQVPAVPNGTAPAPVHGTITIPASAQAGMTRLRVAVHRGLADFGPCTTGGNGEFEDYALYINGAGGLIKAPLFVSFDANPKSGGVHTEWTVSRAGGTAYFVVERAHGTDFQAIGQLAYDKDGHYHFTDIAPAPGINYYRLKCVQSDGKEVYSGVVPVDFRSARRHGEVGLFPTYSTGIFHLNLSALAGMKAGIKLTDAQGRIFKSWSYEQVPAGVLDFYVDHFTPGLYFVRIEAANGATVVRRLILHQ